MTRSQYEKRKRERLEQAWSPRQICARCRKPTSTCYCEHIRPFSSTPEFAILIHRNERKKSVATGLMSHLCLANSRLFEGTDFTEDPEVNALIEDPTVCPVLLYPATAAHDLGEMGDEDRARLFPKEKRIVVFVVDGTWAQARRMIRLSRNLQRLPCVRFQPPTRSAFHVRQQPRPECYSTIESVHHIIELFGKGEGRHRTLLDAFSAMVNQQIAYGHRNLVRKYFRSR